MKLYMNTDIFHIYTEELLKYLQLSNLKKKRKSKSGLPPSHTNFDN